MAEIAMKMIKIYIKIMSDLYIKIVFISDSVIIALFAHRVVPCD